MNFPPVIRQLFVASAPQLAAVSVGGFIGFPGILFPQLRANDSIIHLDVDTASWIGSTHGLAGIFAFLIPLLMQYKGRKLTFILCCLVGIIGWIIVYLAQSADALIIAEMIHGLCTYSLLTCSMQTISEMVHPRFRIISMNMYFLGQALGMNLILLIGRQVSWKKVALIECCPLVLALLIGLAWPESPAWLAYKRKFDKCETAFKWLRGADAGCDEEFKEMIRANKETLAQRKAKNPFKFNKNSCGNIWMTTTQKDFYLPCLHTSVLICFVYWSGVSVVLVYTMDMLQQVTGSESAASLGVIIIYLSLLFGNALGLIMLKYCKNKTVIIAGGTGAGVFMFAACVVSYLKEIEILSHDTLLCMYCLIGYTVSFNLGAGICALAVATELMPVKHRGVGSAYYTILASLLDFSALKLSPYLFLYIKLWGTFLVYAINAMLCILFIWRFVPETKNRTLQEVEDFYNHGHFVKRRLDDDVLETIKDSNL